MPVSVQQDETRYVVQLEGEIGVPDAAELKRLLVEGLASGRKLYLDLMRIHEAGEIGAIFMQLLHATLRETDRAGTGLAMRTSAAAEKALREAGFGMCIETAVWSD